MSLGRVLRPVIQISCQTLSLSESTETVLRDKNPADLETLPPARQALYVVWFVHMWKSCREHKENFPGSTSATRSLALLFRRFTRHDMNQPWFPLESAVTKSSIILGKKKGSIYTIRLRSLTWLQGRWIPTLLTKPIFTAMFTIECNRNIITSPTCPYSIRQARANYGPGAICGQLSFLIRLEFEEMINRK